MTASIKEEVKILRAGLGKIREEIIEGSVNISQQAVQLQNLLSASKTGLTSFKGRTDGKCLFLSFSTSFVLQLDLCIK